MGTAPLQDRVDRQHSPTASNTPRKTSGLPHVLRGVLDGVEECCRSTRSCRSKGAVLHSSTPSNTPRKTSPWGDVLRGVLDGVEECCRSTRFCREAGLQDHS